MQSLTHLTYDTSVNCVSVDFSDKVKKKKIPPAAIKMKTLNACNTFLWLFVSVSHTYKHTQNIHAHIKRHHTHAHTHTHIKRHHTHARAHTHTHTH